MSRWFQPRYEYRDHPKGWAVLRVSVWGTGRKVAVYKDEDAAQAVAHMLGEYAYLEK